MTEPPDTQPPATGGIDGHLYWATVDAKAAAAKLEVDADLGLSTEEARQRLAKHGPNRLAEARGRNFFDMLRDQMTEPLVFVLMAAAALSALLREWTDVAVILAIAGLNAVLGASQERRAEASLAALQRMGAPTAKVFRDGHLREAPAEELVPGDVILLEAGDRVPGDARLVEAASLRADESALTGESEPVEKSPAPLGPADVHGLGDFRNLVFSGTAIAYGRGRAVVYGTGMSTALGSIAGLLASEPREPTPLQRKMAEVGRTLGMAAGVLVLLVFVIGLWRGQPVIDMLLTAVSLAVAAIPEGLPAIVTIVLALGVQRMAERNAVVRRLPAVETLGAANVIASDKTGTLTLNRMTVTRLATPRAELDLDNASIEDVDRLPPDVAALAVGAALANDGRLEEEAGTVTPVGDPTDTALLVAARRLGFRLDALNEAFPRLSELPFDSDRKRMTTFHRVAEGAERFLPRLAKPGHVVALTKGAPDVVVDRCTVVMGSDGVRPMTPDQRERILAANDRLAGQALRVLAVAGRAWGAVPDPPAPERIEEEMVFLGLIGMLDPPRPEAARSIKEAKSAGIRTLMVTGDHAATAAAIARRLELVDPGETLQVVSGRELEQMDDPTLRQVVQSVSVFARVSPEHKLRIVRALKANGAVVAVTGDGVNDAPALKGADIGCAMGVNGTDVSRAAADMVLADDNYATIVAAVREGRVIYDNIRKSIHYLLSCNIGEIVAIFLGIALGLGAPLTPIQILWVNLVTDGLPALALGVEPAEPGIMNRRPRNPKDSIFSGGLGAQVLWQGIMLGLLTLGVYWWGLTHAGPSQARTMAFGTLAFTQLTHSVNVRSPRAGLSHIGWFSNPPLLLAVATSAALQVAVMSVPFLAAVFDVVPVEGSYWRLLVPLVLAPLLVVEAAKGVGRRMAGRRAAAE